MCTSNNTDDGLLKEQAAVLPVTANPGVTNQMAVIAPSGKAAKYGYFGNPSLKFFGVVYRYWLDKQDSEDHGKSYVGETTDEITRRKNWNKPNSPDYSGSRISEARTTYGTLCWVYEVLEIVYASTMDELKELLIKRETYYIAQFNSYDNGFNGNRGGTGNTGVVFDEARRKQNGDNRRGKRHSKVTIEKIRIASTGRVKSAAERKKISDGNTGKKRTKEMRQAQSERMKGKVPEAANLARKGKPSKLRGRHQTKAEITKRVASRKESGQRIKVTAADGTIMCYLCQTDAAKGTGLKDGSVYYALSRPDGMHRKSGNKFEVISDADYQAWKSARP